MDFMRTPRVVAKGVSGGSLNQRQQSQSAPMGLAPDFDTINYSTSRAFA